MNAQYIADRIAFCREQIAAAIRRGDDSEVRIWRELVEMWQATPGYDPSVKGSGYDRVAE